MADPEHRFGSAEQACRPARPSVVTNAEKDPIPNTRLISASWDLKLVKTVEAPAGESASAKLRFGSVRRTPARRVESYRRRAQLTIWFRGGATCQVMTKCNGVTRRWDGDADLFSVLQWAGWAQGLH